MALAAFTRHSIKTKITTIMLAIFVASLWSLSYYASRMLRVDMERLLADQQSSALSYMAGELNHELTDRVIALEKVAPAINQSMLNHPAVMQQWLENHPIVRDMFNAGVIAAARDGTAVADVPIIAGRKGTNYASNVAIHTTLTEGKSVIGDPVVGRVSQQALFSISVPIRDARGKVIGTLFGVINLTKPSFLDRIGKHRYGKSGGYLVINQQRNLIVTATDKSRILQSLPALGSNETVDQRRRGFFGPMVAVNPLGAEILSSASRIPVSDWLVVATLPTEEAFAPIRDMQRRMLFATIFLTLVVGALIWWKLRRQLAPMLTAVQTLANLSNSNQLPQHLAITKNDEIGQLIGGFNRLLATLAHREEALKESEYRWKFAIEGAGDGVWDWNLQTDEAKYSKRWTEMLGYAEADILPTNQEWVSRIHPEDCSHVAATMQAYLDGETEIYVVEYRLRCKDESYKWILGRGMVVSRNEDGKPLRMIGTHTDITDRKQDEQTQLHKIIEAAPDPMLLVGNDGIIIFANLAAESTFGYTLIELIGQYVDILVPSKLRQSHVHFRKKFSSECSRNLSPLNFKNTLAAVHKNGTEFPVEIRLSRLQIEGRAIVIANVHDITERKLADDLLLQSFTEMRRLVDHQQSIKEDERKRIAQDIHDDLGQNLLVLKMDITTLCARIGDLHPALNKSVQAVLNNIDATIKSVKAIMNDLRPMALELGLYPAAEWQLKQFERISGISCKLTATTPLTSFGLDESQTLAVFRILQESLTNVARHAQATEVEITFSQDERGFSMKVKDNGKGLLPDDRKKTNSFGLMGIKERIHSLGGELIVASNPGKGTIILISIPSEESKIED